MTYNLALANITPAASSFTVMVNSVARTVNSVVISGTKVQLTLSTPVVSGNVVTVAYTRPSSNPLQTSGGGQAITIGAQTVTNNVSAVSPVYVSSVIQNASPSLLEMTYNLALANITPAASSFTVMVNSVARTVNSVVISGTKVQLTLSTPVVSGNVVTVAYTKPSSNPLQTSGGGQAITIGAQTVTNNVSAVSPVYVSSVIQNASPSLLEMTYNPALANITPAASSFTVMVNSVARTVNSVVISGTKVQLTLSTPVVSGNVVTVAYTKPSSNPLQTSGGGQAITIGAQTVTNNVSAVSPVYVSSVIQNATPSLLEMTYNLALANITPAASSFTVMVNSVARTVNSVVISGTKVQLTLSTPVVSGNVVTVAYTKPSSNPLQTSGGGQAITIGAQTVTNGLVATGAIYYVSPTGSDASAGTITAPWATWHYAFSRLVAGDILYIRGGLYTPNATLSGGPYVGARISYKNGTASNPILISAYGNEVPILDGSKITQAGWKVGLFVDACSYIKFKGLTVQNIQERGYAGSPADGWIGGGSNHITMEQCTLTHCGGGFSFGGTCDYIYFTNCDSYNNADLLFGTGTYCNGFSQNGAHGTHIFYEGCRAWNNSDDGFHNMGAAGYITYNNCWGFENGHTTGDWTNIVGNGDGFKLGLTPAPKEAGVQRICNNCIAWSNDLGGFDESQDNGPVCDMTLFNCTAYNNKRSGFGFYSTTGGYAGVATLKNCIAYRNDIAGSYKQNVNLRSNSILSNNSWQSGTVTDADFISLVSAAAKGPRKADGSLPDVSFMHLVNGSHLINAGVYVGLAFNDSAPDLGAFETAAGSRGANRHPVVRISNPIKGNVFEDLSTITLDATASDPDGVVSKVEFYNGTTKLVEMDAEPYSFTWKDVVAGNYSITAVATDNMNDTTISAPIEFIVGTPVKYDFNSENVKLYPNPNNGHFSIEFVHPVKDEKSEIIISDLSGRQIYRGPVLREELSKEFDLPGIRSGTYVMMIRDKEILVTKKFIKR